MPLEAYTYLATGMSGSAVKEMQQDLISLGFSVGPTGADGKFGANTVQAVKDFQYTYGISVDGTVGIQTAAAIKEALNLLAQGQWSPSSDPLKYVPGAVAVVSKPPVYSYPPVSQVPSLFSSLLGEGNIKWIGLGVLGIALIFYLRKQGSFSGGEK